MNLLFHRALRDALLLGVTAMLLLPLRSSAAVITIINQDGANEGFNDPTAVAPVGGNSGTTLGQQRLIVFQTAANIWGGILTSSIQIKVQAQFNSLPCDATSGVLGSAGPLTVHRNFSGAPFADTWYHSALASRLAGIDINGGNNDINAQFNSDVDNDACLGTAHWYYGLDGNEGTDIELLPVVLHEMGHGLGFSNLIDETSGTLRNGFPDVYSRFTLDNTTGLHWNEMNNAERIASAVNTGNVVWDGVATTTHASLFLGGRPIVQVNSPPAIAGQLLFGTASFGPPLSEPGVTADVVLVDDGSGVPTDACSAILNDVSGKIALIDRGSCTFVSKAQAAEAGGALAVVIANNVSGAPPQMGGTDTGIGIPVVSVSLDDGNAIKAELGGGTVNMTIGLDPDHMAGADDAGRVLLYAPDPVEPGSSISHWDVSAFPNLLMEPAINDNLSSDVDLTLYHFEDIGWFPQLVAAGTPPVTSVGLAPNAPNPFGQSTTIRFDLDRDGPARLDVFDLGGRLVKRLFSGSATAGPHVVSWDGTDAAGRRLAPGVYLYRLRAGWFDQARRMVLME